MSENQQPDQDLGQDNIQVQEQVHEDGQDLGDIQEQEQENYSTEDIDDAFSGKKSKKEKRFKGYLTLADTPAPRINPVSNLIDIFSYLNEATASFRFFPTGYINLTLIIAAKLTAFVLFLVSLITFIATNGFGEQFIAIGTEGLMASFTTGATNLYFHDIVYPIAVILMLISLLTGYFLYIKYGSIVKKVFMIIILLLKLSIILLFVPIVLVFFTISYGNNFIFSESSIAFTQWFASLMANYGEDYMNFIQNPAIIAIVCIAFVGLHVATFIMMSRKTEMTQNLFKHWIMTALEIFIVFPLLLLLLKNIVPLAIFVIIVAVIIGLVKLFSSGGGGSESSGSGGGSSSSGSSRSSSSSGGGFSSGSSGTASSGKIVSESKSDYLFPSFKTSSGQTIIVVPNGIKIKIAQNYAKESYWQSDNGLVERNIIMVKEAERKNVKIVNGNYDKVKKEHS